MFFVKIFCFFRLHAFFNRLGLQPLLARQFLLGVRRRNDCALDGVLTTKLRWLDLAVSRWNLSLCESWREVTLGWFLDLVVGCHTFTKSTPQWRKFIGLTFEIYSLIVYVKNFTVRKEQRFSYRKFLYHLFLTKTVMQLNEI